MASSPLITPELRAEVQQALDNAMCGDFCYEQNCPKCAEARVDAAVAVLGKVPKLIVQEKWRQVKVLVADGVLPKQVQTVLEDLLRGWPK